MIAFFVPGPPVPQPRPRVYANGGVLSNPPRVKAFKDAVTLVARNACAGEPLPDPVWLYLLFLMPRPKRLKGEDREWHWCTPDLDNLVKSTKDAMTAAGVWVDDAQVCHCEASKRYAAKGEKPGVHVKVVPAE